MSTTSELAKKLANNTMFRQVSGSDGDAIILVTHGLMRPREGWPLLPMALVLRRRIVEALPTFVNTVKNNEQLVDIAELLETYRRVYGEERAKVHVARFKAMDILEDFIFCRKPLIDLAVGFYAKMASEDTPDADFAYSRRVGGGGTTGNRFLTALVGADRLFESLLGFWVKLTDIVEFYKEAIRAGAKLWGRPHYHIYIVPKDSITVARRADTVDDVVDKLIMDTVGRVPSNGVFILGIDRSKDSNQRGKAFLALARRVASIPFIDALEDAEIIAADDATAAIVVMYFSSMDPEKVDMITDDEVTERVPVNPDRKTIINRKLAKAWYGRRIQQASVTDMSTIDILFGGEVGSGAGTSTRAGEAETGTGGEAGGEDFMPVGPKEVI